MAQGFALVKKKIEPDLQATLSRQQGGRYTRRKATGKEFSYGKLGVPVVGF